NNEDFSRDIVSKVAKFFKDTDIKITESTSIGDPASEILHLTENDETIDIIVMSTHGMSTTKRFLLGSVTNKVVHHINIPILIIR
ncbi:MAG: universal stress protein, partial [Clostridiales bacterium]|nr:universal stress protein [Clostridiales bacterium]